ncbi:hypothetical protein ACFVSX_29955 [Streptomyces rubiginosohelvolus]|uniref:hypothetical protein n=1 Tax=Streptomyces rubiginosohelvolus TaxID=67362 RepID=UPI0036DB034A
MLDTAGSAYRVDQDGDGLEERVTPAVRDAVSQAVADAEAEHSAGAAAEHVSTAWRAVYEQHPDSVRAYSEAIKAVECKAHSVIQPNHGRATLGTMLGEIGNALEVHHRYIHSLERRPDRPNGSDDARPVGRADHQAWQADPTVPETLEAAPAGVHLAATLVQWFTSGAVVRTP